MKELSCADEAGIRALLIGRTITKVTADTLSLDDGTVLQVVPNIGGCSCGAGDYELDELNDCPNMVMNVEFEDEEGEWDAHTYRIFVYAANQKIKLLEVSGDDGSGYYGTGYWIKVKK